MKRTGLALLATTLVVALTGLVLAAPVLCLHSTGGIAIDLQSVVLSLDATFAVDLAWNASTSRAVLSLTDGGAELLDVSSTASLDRLGLEASALFAVQTASYLSGTFSGRWAGDSTELAATAVHEPGALGVGLTLTATHPDSPMRGFVVGLNLDPFGEIQTDSCQLVFTYAEAELSLACPPCADPISATLLYDAAGFVECFLAASRVGSLPLSVTLGASVLFEPEQKTLEFQPSLSLENPPCIDLYAGLSWDAAAQTLEGIRLYGIGARCEVGEARFRGLWALDPSQIALVKAPYWSLLGLIWDLPTCCELVGEGSVALFFGDQNLFDLEEVLAEFVLPITERSSISLAAQLAMDGGFTLTFGWDLSF